MELHYGPMSVDSKYFLCSSQRKELQQKYGCKAQVRYREAWGFKGLVIVGPPGVKIRACKEEVVKLLEANFLSKLQPTADDEADEGGGCPDEVPAMMRLRLYPTQRIPLRVYAHP